VEATGQARSLPGDKKETGRLGPVSMAAAEMQLHQSRRLLALEICAARDASASASRASKSQGASTARLLSKQIWGQC